MGSRAQNLETGNLTPADLLHATGDTLRVKAVFVHDRLCAEYHCPIAYFGERDPLSELVSALLSHRTKNADSRRAYKALLERFHTWEQVRDAPIEQLETLIASCTWPEQKAPRLKRVLEEITAYNKGVLSLDWLEALTDEDATRWLETLPGVGPKTSASVLSFSRLRRAALAVDSHHHRVAQRLGLIGPNVAVGRSHAILAAQLPSDWSPQQVYDNHKVLMFHGQRCCYWHDPECHRCAVLDVCPTGQDIVTRRGGPGTSL